LTRRQFSQRNNIPVTTLDYWRLKFRKASKTSLVEVAIEKETATENAAWTPGFRVVLLNGRRIESPWIFREADLSVLIRVVESA
jgi:hypothetical protein